MSHYLKNFLYENIKYDLMEYTIERIYGRKDNKLLEF